MINLGVKGEYGFQVLRKDGSIKEEVPCVPNILLDSFFNLIQTFPDSGTSYSIRQKFIRIGTSTLEPAVTQTQLGNTVASIDGGSYADYSTSNVTTDGTTWTASINMKFVFPVGVFAGNITEVGINFINGSLGNLAIHSRSLIKDGLGALRPITLTLEDQLVVTYKLTMSGPEEVTGNVSLNGNIYNYVSRRSSFASAGIGDFLFAINSQSSGAYPAGATFGANGVAISGAGHQSFNPTPAALAGTAAGGRRVQLAFPTTSGNMAGGIGFVYWAGFAKIAFTPAIPKTADQAFNIVLGYTIGRA